MDRRRDRARSAWPGLLLILASVAAVVIGGGPVGERKVAGLMAVGASVTLVAPAATARLRELTEDQARLLKHGYYASSAGPTIEDAINGLTEAMARIWRLIEEHEGPNGHLAHLFSIYTQACSRLSRLLREQQALSGGAVLSAGSWAFMLAGGALIKYTSAVMLVPAPVAVTSSRNRSWRKTSIVGESPTVESFDTSPMINWPACCGTSGTW